MNILAPSIRFISSNIIFKTFKCISSMNHPIVQRNFHITCQRLCLMEFFDEKENWGSDYIKHGRSWKTDELRIKSNSDLHKLWYVLLKEKNMLLTMQYAYEKNAENFPNPERLDKVEESMTNLEKVIRERNEAYYYLETGETGERPIKTNINAFGDYIRYKASEHIIPKEINKSYKAKYMVKDIDQYGYQFQDLKFEKRIKDKNKEESRHRNHVFGLLKRYENLDEEAIKQSFPSTDPNKLKKKITDKFYDNWKGRYH